MLRRLQTLVVLTVCAVAMRAAAQPSTEEQFPAEEPSGESAAGPESDSFSEPSAEASPVDESPEREHSAEASATTVASSGAGLGLSASTETADGLGETPRGAEHAGPESDATATESAGRLSGWDTFITGYFRAPMAIGLSPRPGPDNPNGPSSLQMSYGPNRTVDANYYSFAYTRLQEQDWAEMFIHAKKKHAEAVIGWMGYWFQSASFRNLDAGWVPGMAYLTLDSDFDVGATKPNIALTMGAWWPQFGQFAKYDTFTLGRFRQVGEQLQLTIPFNSDLSLTLVQGFGTGRDGSFSLLAPPPYQAKVGLDLIHYEHLKVAYRDVVEVGVHYNAQWTRDPNLFQTPVAGKAYTDAKKASLTTIGGEATLRVPVAGSLWVSPSYIQVESGWALAKAGVEVMHAISAEGLATNYLGWSGSLADSTGSGSMFNVGFLYENTLSSVLGQPRGSAKPEVTLNVFGLFTDITLDLPDGSVITQDRIGQFKYGADVEVQALDWLGIMLRWDEVNYNISHPGYIFSAISPRLTVSSHFLSGESIYLQYSRYSYGDAMLLAGKWPWGTPLVAGSDIIQGGPYSGQKPDMDVVRLQASVSF